MADEDRLADELASLRIQRDAPRGSGRTEARRSGSAGWLVAILVIALLGVGGFFVFREGKARVFAAEVELGSIALQSPQQEDVTLVATGYVYSRKKANVAPKISGRIARLYVQEGDKIKDGQLVAELETGDAQAALAQVKADIAAARARVERARADLLDADAKLAREKALLDRGAGTDSAFTDARLKVDSNKAQLSAVEAEMRATEARQQAAQVTLDNCRVRAPFGGVVVRKLLELGETSTPASAGIFTIADLADLEVQADVSESQFAKVKVTTPAEILLDAFPDKRFRGEVSEIRQSVDRSKASVTVKVKFSDDATGVLPDMAAKVSFLSKKLDDAALKQQPKLVVPTDALVVSNGRTVVYTVDENRARAVEVIPGAKIGNVTELKNGPSPGTKVIRNPSAELRDGSPIKEKTS
jgi:RND family efflux transporter MFP subunit